MRSAGIVQIFCVQVDFGPARGDGLRGTGGRQNQQLHCPGRQPRLLAQLGHECANLGVGQRGVMLDPPDLGQRRQEIFQMAAPAGGILAAPMAASRCRIQYRFDALADPAGGFGLRGPDRLQHPHH